MPSKLSVHLSGYPNNVYSVLARMQPSVIKVFNQSSEMNIDALRGVCPNAIRFYRHFHPTLDYHASADAFFDSLSDTLNKLKTRNVIWEGINEPVINSVDDAKALNAWTVRFAALMHAQGQKVAGFSWSTGNPPNIAGFVSYLVEAARAVDVHAFHEYYRSDGSKADWFRYRAFEAALPQDARRPVVITECGLDDGGNSQTDGYIGKRTPQQYVTDMQGYDAGLLADPYVLGATIYQWGDGSWPSFELAPAVTALADYVASQGGGARIPVPWPVMQGGTVTPTYSFSVKPEVVTAGQSAQLKWDVENVKAVYLDGKGVSGHETRVVAPKQTTTYTLHIVLTDGATKDLTATLTVQAAPPPSGPVVPSDPRLAAYPRPVNDNGWGIHWGANIDEKVIAQFMPFVEQMLCRWLMVWSQSPEMTGLIAKACAARGIMPVVRPGVHIDDATGGMWAAHVRAMQAAGFARPYIQIYNEVSDGREWKDGHTPSDYRSRWINAWKGAAQEVLNAGGLPGAQCLDPGELRDLVRASGPDVWRTGWFSVHPYALNHPPGYPLSRTFTGQFRRLASRLFGGAAWTDDQVADAVEHDDISIYTHYMFARVFQQEVGFVPPHMACEGGFPIGAADDTTYPKITKELHRDYHLEWYRWFSRGTDSLGKLLPDYYFAINPWVLFGFWWQWKDGIEDCQATIDAIGAEPAFVRKFQGGTVDPVYYLKLTPTTIQKGQSAVLEYYAQYVDGAWLDGVALAPAVGTKTVSPAQTTTYTMRVKLKTAQYVDVPATLTVQDVVPPPVIDCFVDPRLTWITVNQGEQARVKAVWFYDSKPTTLERARSAFRRAVRAVRRFATRQELSADSESEGNIRIIAYVQNPSGFPVFHEKVTQIWPDDEAPKWTRIGNVDFDQSGDSNFDPAHGPGPYSVTCRDARVSGFGLPLKQHVEYLVVFVVTG